MPGAVAASVEVEGAAEVSSAASVSTGWANTIVNEEQSTNAEDASH